MVIFSVTEPHTRKGRSRKRTSPQPCNSTDNNPGNGDPGNFNPGNDIREEPGMRDNSGFPIPAPDREVNPSVTIH